MKSVRFLSSGLTLNHPNLSHMDFLDGPAAIPRSKLIISDTTKDESSNELINPEILANNHHKHIYSFTLILPSIFPDTLISSCVCIKLLFETNSSSHVEYQIARQRGPLGPETSILACLTSSNYEICQISIKWTDLDLSQSFSH